MTKPRPPAKLAARNASRTTSGSTPNCRAMPAQTPATTRCAGSRRRAVAGRADMAQMVSVAPRQAAGQQRRADEQAGERRERGEAQGDGARRVEGAEDAVERDEHAGHERGDLHAPHARHTALSPERPYSVCWTR